MTDVELRAALVQHLIKDRYLVSKRWMRAFERVPRHVFIPRLFLEPRWDGHYIPIDGSLPEHRDEWLAAAYTDDTAITQLDGDDRVWKTALAQGEASGDATSSSSQPSLMALMLEALDVRDGDRVLEIGTGTGYNAALMCEALGSECVASVDIDAGLVASAKERLNALGYAPTLAVADGAGGFAEAAPYDRILATCSLPSVPPAWLTQVRDGGRILVNLQRGLSADGLVLLTAGEKRDVEDVASADKRSGILAGSTGSGR